MHVKNVYENAQIIVHERNCQFPLVFEYMFTKDSSKNENNGCHSRGIKVL